MTRNHRPGAARGQNRLIAGGASLKFAASAEPRKDSILRAVAAAVEDLGSREDWNDSLTYKVNLVLDELTTNIVSYGGVEGRLNPEIEIDIASRGDELLIEISDDGRPFDPLNDPPPAPVNYKSTDFAVVGGLGIHLVRSTVDTISYRREGGRNRIAMTARRY